MVQANMEIDIEEEIEEQMEMQMIQQEQINQIVENTTDIKFKQKIQKKFNL